jgi:S1-C subfamily serine protease
MICRKYIFLLFLIALVGGCKTRPVEEHRYPLLAPGNATLADAAKAIAEGGARQGWKMSQVEKDRFYATRRFRQHVIMVDLQFNTKRMWIKYRDSVNMKYDGTSIHKAYNREVNYLAGRIQLAARFMVPSASVKGTKGDGWGTGFVISGDNHILTNHHVAGDCEEVLAGAEPAKVVASDEVNDLALLSVRGAAVLGEGPAAGSIAVFRASPRLRKGEDVVVAGYPLPGLLATEMKITTGSLNALSGINDDRREFQFSAAIQPGNSGGPAFDRSGHVIGVVSSGVSDRLVVGWTGKVPQNVNFAIGLGMVRSFLEAEDVDFLTEASDQALPSYEIAEQAQGFTLQIQCKN